MSPHTLHGTNDFVVVGVVDEPVCEVLESAADDVVDDVVPTVDEGENCCCCCDCWDSETRC